MLIVEPGNHLYHHGIKGVAALRLLKHAGIFIMNRVPVEMVKIGVEVMIFDRPPDFFKDLSALFIV